MNHYWAVYGKEFGRLFIITDSSAWNFKKYLLIICTIVGIGKYRSVVHERKGRYEKITDSKNHINQHIQERFFFLLYISKQL